MLTAPGARRIVGGGEVEAHPPEQGVQESFGLAQREMGEEPQGQGGLDGEIRVPLPGHPHRHIAAANEGAVVGRPVRHAIFRLVYGMNLRLHPCSVAPAETRRANHAAPPADGLHAITPLGVPMTHAESVAEQQRVGLPAWSHEVGVQRVNRDLAGRKLTWCR